MELRKINAKLIYHFENDFCQQSCSIGIKKHIQTSPYAIIIQQ